MLLVEEVQICLLKFKLGLPKYKGWVSCESESAVAQLCPTLRDPMSYNPPGSSVHGIFQARILEWVLISFSGDLPDPGIEPRSPALHAGSLLTELPGNLYLGPNRTVKNWEAWCVHGVAKSSTPLRDWTTIQIYINCKINSLWVN